MEINVGEIIREIKHNIKIEKKSMNVDIKEKKFGSAQYRSGVIYGLRYAISMIEQNFPPTI